MNAWVTITVAGSPPRRAWRRRPEDGQVEEFRFAGRYDVDTGTELDILETGERLVVREVEYVVGRLVWTCLKASPEKGTDGLPDQEAPGLPAVRRPALA